MSATDEAGILINLELVDKPFDILQEYDPDEMALTKEWKYCREYYNKYGVAPSKVILKEDLPDIFEYEVDDNWRYYHDKLQAIQKLKLVQQVNVGVERLVERGEVNEAIEYALNHLSNGNKKNGNIPDGISMSDIDAVLEIYNKRRNRRMLGKIGWPTGFQQIDKDGNGLFPGDLLGILARPGVSKTYMLLYSAYSAWIKGAKVIFISPEMVKDEILFRLLPIVAYPMGIHLSNKMLRLGMLDNMEVLIPVLTQLSSGSLFHIAQGDSKSGVSIEYIRHLVDKYLPDVLAIDGVRLYNAGKGSSWEVLDETFYTLRDLAVQKELAVIVSHQANRGAANTINSPRLEHAAGGDGLVKAASYMLAISRDEADSDIRYTQLLKHRFGEIDMSQKPLMYNVDVGEIGEYLNYELDSKIIL